MYKHINSVHSVERGMGSEYTRKDFSSTVMVVLKHGGEWDFLARIFGMKGATFERLITTCIRKVADTIYEFCVNSLLESKSMSKILEEDKGFKNNSYERYATDVIFEQANRPSGNLKEGRRNFSGKRKL